MADTPEASAGERLNPDFATLNLLAEDILRSIKAIVATCPDEGFYKCTALFFFTKGWRTFRSIYSLCSRRLGEDGSILARSLFEAVVTMRYISQEPLKRARLFHEYDFVQRKMYYDGVLKATDPFSERLLKSTKPEAIAALLKDYDRVKDNYSDIYSWSGFTIKKMAEKVEMEYQYRVVYSMRCNLAHPSPRSIQSYFKGEGDGFTLSYDSEPVEITKAWLACYIYFLMIIDMLNAAFELDFKDRIEAINKLLLSSVPTMPV